MKKEPTELEQAFQYVLKHGRFPKGISVALLFELKKRMKQGDSPYFIEMKIEKGDKPDAGKIFHDDQTQKPD